jgi:hypothetical protein
MTFRRFEEITRMHVFIVPNNTAYANDKLYPIRAFVDAYNENLQNDVVPGKHLCVDESMNQ